MSVSCSDFYQLANQLADGATEIEWRNAAARAYYAAFHKAQEVADLCPDLSHLKMGSHERLAARFQAHGTNGAKSIAYVLNTMKRVRHVADYEIVDEFEKSTCESQIAQFPVFKDKITSFENQYRQKEA